MFDFYMLGYYLAYILVGALFGLISLIVAFKNKKKPIGIAAIIVCPLSALYAPILSVFMAIVFLVLALVKPKE